MNPWTYTLSPQEIKIADAVGARRAEGAITHGRREKNGASEDRFASLRRHLLGSFTELASIMMFRAHGFTDVWWSGYLDTGVHNKLPDYTVNGMPFDTKGIVSEHHKLIVQFDDDPNWIYPLVCNQRHPTYEMLGWVYGREAQVKLPNGDYAYYFCPRPNGAACFVPRGVWHDPDEMLGVIHEHTRGQGQSEGTES